MQKVGWVVDRRLESSGGLHRSVVKTTALFSNGTIHESEEVSNETKDETCPSFVVKQNRVVYPMATGDRQLHLTECRSALDDNVNRVVKAVFSNLFTDESNTLPASDLRIICSEIAEVELTAPATCLILRALGAEKKGSRLELGEFLAYWPGIAAYFEYVNKRGELLDSSTPTSTVHVPIVTLQPDASSATPTAKDQVVQLGAQPMGDGGAMMTPVERDVFKEINIARTQPHVYAEIMEMGSVGKLGLEQRTAWIEAAGVLKKMRPLAPIKEVPLGLYLAAKDHAMEQSASGSAGHGGGDGSLPSERCNRYGAWQSSLGENLTYGSTRAQDIVVSMIVDEGVPSRGHRENLFGTWSVAGVAVEQHPKYQHVCVVNFAGGYSSRREDAKQKRAKQAATLRNKGEDAVATPVKKTAVSHQQVPRSKIKVYGRENCGQCRTMFDALNAASVPYMKLDIDKDRSFFPVMTHCGYRGGRFGLPVVVVPGKNTAHWDICDTFRLVAELTAMMENESRQHGGDRGGLSPTGPTEVVKLYVNDTSPRCSSLCRMLDDLSVSYDKYDIEEDWSCLKPMTDSGYEGGEVSPPVVVVGGKAHWNVTDIRGLAQCLSGQAPGEASEKLSDLLLPHFVPTLSNIVVDTFKLCDSRGDGTLDKDEVQHFLHELYTALGFPTRPDEIQRKEIIELYRKHDADRNQKVCG